MKIRSIILISVLIIAIGIMLGSLLSDESVGATVAIIPITGPISIDGSGTLFSGDGTSSSDVARWIDEAEQTTSIKIILLEINSPGGSAVASDEITRAIEHANKPVVAWIREMGASGAYWAASESDWIIANRMSITGSVGVNAAHLGFGEFLEEHNVTYERITGGKYKDIGTPYAEMTTEERRILQRKIDTIQEFFLDDVQQNRNLSDSQRAEIETGIFFLGTEAYELGLVDELGGRAEVQAYLNKQLGKKPIYRRYEPEKSFFAQLAGVKSTTLPLGLRIES